MTGNTWAIRAAALGSDNGLFEGYKPAFNEGAPRDFAAQIIYNAIFATTITYRDGVASKVGDDNKDNKTVGERDLNLIQKFAVVAGNDKFVLDDRASTTAKGQTRLVPSSDVDSKTASDNTKQNYVTSSPAVTFECDMDLLGLEVKVLYRDPKTTNSNKTNFYGDPDLNSTIYGMTPTGKNRVYNVTKGDLDDEDGSKMDLGKEFGKVKVAKEFDIYYNFRDDDKAHIPFNGSVEDNAKAATKELKKDSADRIQFVTDNDGNLRYALVTEKVYAKVSNVTSDKVTFVGAKAIDIDTNDIYSGIAKDDVVAVSVLYKAYKDMDDSDAYVTAAKVDTVEGSVSSLAGDHRKKITIGETTYGAYEAGGLSDTNYIQLGTAEDYKLSSKIENSDKTDGPDAPNADDLDEDYTLFTDGGYWFAYLNTAGTVKNYCVVTGADKNGLEDRVKIMDSEGNEKTYTLDEDSAVKLEKINDTTYGFSVNGASDEQLKAQGYDSKANSIVQHLFRFSITSSGDIKLKRDRVYATSSATPSFDKSGKTFASKATASNAVAFFHYENASSASKWDALSVDHIDDVKNDTKYVARPEYAQSGNDVIAFVMGNKNKPGSSSNLSYGFVTKDPAVITLSGDKYTQLTVWNGAEEAVIKIDDDGEASSDGTVKKRDFVAYELGANNIVDDTDFYSMNDNGPDGGKMFSAPLYNYNASRKSMQIYKGVTSNDTATVGVTDDVKIIYVNVDDGKGVSSGTPTEANLISGRHVPNVVYKMIRDDSRMKVDVIFIDTDNDLYHAKDDGTSPAYYKSGRLAVSDGTDFDASSSGGSGGGGGDVVTPTDPVSSSVKDSAVSDGGQGVNTKAQKIAIVDLSTMTDAALITAIKAMFDLPVDVTLLPETRAAQTHNQAKVSYKDTEVIFTLVEAFDKADKAATEANLKEGQTVAELVDAYKAANAGVTGVKVYTDAAHKTEASGEVKAGSYYLVVSTEVGVDADVTLKVSTSAQPSTGEGIDVSGSVLEILSAEVITGSDRGADDGKLKFTMAAPEGVLSATSLDALAVIDGVAVTVSGAIANGVGTFMTADADEFTVGQEIKLSVEGFDSVTGAVYNVEVKLGDALANSGYTVVKGAKGYNGTDAFEITLRGLEAYMGAVDVKYTVSGLGTDSGQSTEADVAVTDGTLDPVEVIAASKTPTGTVVVTIDEIKVKEVAVKLPNNLTADDIDGTINNTGTDLATFLGTTTITDWPKTATGTVDLTVTGLTRTGKDDVMTGLEVDINGEVTLPSDDNYVVTGDQVVKVEISNITYKTYDKTAFTPNGKVGGQAVAVSLDDDMKLTKSGSTYTNEEELTLKLTPSNAFTANKKATVKLSIGATMKDGSSLTTTETANDTNAITVTIAAGALEVDPTQPTIFVLITEVTP